MEALEQLKNPPKLIITDSQVFDYVYEHKPEKSLLTSFSVLFADYKGDLDYYKEGAKKLMNLSADSRVLIAECCTHAPLKEDIGREKIPRMLKKKYGETLEVTVVSGTDYPQRPDPIRPDYPVRRLHVQPQIRPPPHPTGKRPGRSHDQLRRSHRPTERHPGQNCLFIQLHSLKSLSVVHYAYVFELHTRIHILRE